ncbi:MAG: type ISP restriction/modification enzyme [Spirochaetota bacterium]
MPATDRDQIRAIKTFPSLLKYLRDELGWRIDSDDIDELTFKYTPEELNISAEHAVAIEEIKQLRPLSTGQVWGIFFVKFKPKRLPVVMLRRILSHLVIKKRTGGRDADRKTWGMDDLIFISSYGQTDDRHMTFAHFTTDTSTGDLPTLKVLGWDDDDTPLRYDHVIATLKEKLRWPSDETDVDAWRKTWRSAFTLGHRQVIKTAKDLAMRLAVLAKRIHKRAHTVLKIETENGMLHKLHKAFQTALIRELTEDAFVDMYAQTIAYGLLTASIERKNPVPSVQTGIISKNIVDMVPVTNPFLKEMLSTFLTAGGRKTKLDFDELGVQDVVELLNDPDTHMEDILRDFGKRTMQEDPVIHFYQDFLNEYNHELRVQRGVFYTPQPVVSYIVRSVHELLQTEFGLEDGLASTITWEEFREKQKRTTNDTNSTNKEIKIPEGTDPNSYFVTILDPATGTATFLVEVIDIIHKTMMAKWKKAGATDGECLAKWNEYVPKCLLPRLFGYELMMAPYAIAHMKIGLKLTETGYQFNSDERVRIFLTNALEPPSDAGQQTLTGMFEALAHEAAAVNEVKQQQKFSVLIGNPPYAGHAANLSKNDDGTWNYIGKLLQDYYFIDGVPLGERNPKWLQDDYVKFVRLYQQTITITGVGVIGIITNHSFLDNPTFRGMRHSLLKSLSELRFIDLHGNFKKREISPDGTPDENVFDIQQGVALSFGILNSCGGCENIKHAHLYGQRSYKYDVLSKGKSKDISWRPVQCMPSFFLFLPQDTSTRKEYEEYLRIQDIMPANVLGFQSHRDDFAIAFQAEEIYLRISELRVKTLSNRELAHKYNIENNRDWQIESARAQVRYDKKWQEKIIPCSYRPFDRRACYFSTVAMDYPRKELISNVFQKKNICLGLGRQGIAVQDPIWSLISVSREPIDANIFRRGGINVFPLWLYPEDDSLSFSTKCRTNYSDIFLATLGGKLGIKNGIQGCLEELKAEIIFSYIYAVFHSIAYRTRYAEFLKIDFPRLPLTKSLPLFRSLGKIGAELVSLHLMESKILDDFITEYIGSRSPEVEKISYEKKTVWVDKDQSIGFKGVPENVWNFHIGGYQVCEKWLKDRKGRKLSAEDIRHYQRIVVALSETIRIMGEIDEVIEKHGGWPGAFVTGEAKEK